jgi:membrane protease YdiL (CAAX protease family)
MLVLPLFWLRVIKKYTWKQIRTELFPKYQGAKKEIIGSFALFSALFLGFILITGFVDLIGVNDLDKVSQSLTDSTSNGATEFVITLVIVLFLEEFFFRAFLLKRMGMVPSNLVFTLLHIGYGSTAELIGVFVLGMILAYWYKRNNSLLQNYLGHLLYDFFAILFYLFA